VLGKMLLTSASMVRYTHAVLRSALSQTSKMETAVSRSDYRSATATRVQVRNSSIDPSKLAEHAGTGGGEGSGSTHRMKYAIWSKSAMLY
jgi:phosphatidate phosphatase APP1